MIGVRQDDNHGIWVLDLDIDAGNGIDGVVALHDLGRGKDPIPETRAVRTPRGGGTFSSVGRPTSRTAPDRARRRDVAAAAATSLCPRRFVPTAPDALLTDIEPAIAPDWLVDSIEAVRRRPETTADPDASARSTPYTSERTGEWTTRRHS